MFPVWEFLFLQVGTFPGAGHAAARGCRAVPQQEQHRGLFTGHRAQAGVPQTEVRAVIPHLAPPAPSAVSLRGPVPTPGAQHQHGGARASLPHSAPFVQVCRSFDCFSSNETLFIVILYSAGCKWLVQPALQITCYHHSQWSVSTQFHRQTLLSLTTVTDMDNSDLQSQ